MPTSTRRVDLPPKVTNELAELFQQLCIPQQRRKALDEFLTDDEVCMVVEAEDRNDPHVEYAISTRRILDVLATQRNWSRTRALVELAFGLEWWVPAAFEGFARKLANRLRKPQSHHRRI